MKWRAGRRAQNAFTMIELLVSVVILLMLAALLTPALRRALETSKRAGCLGNLNRISQTCFAYASDHDGFLPGGANVGLSNWKEMWVYELKAYFPTTKYPSNHVLWSPILQCPANKGFADSGSSYGPVVGSTTYYGPCAGGVYDGAKMFSMIRASQIPVPAQTPYWLEIDNRQSADGITPSNQSLYHLQKIHQDGSNALMADGHVQWVPENHWNLTDGIPSHWARNFSLDYQKPVW